LNSGIRAAGMMAAMAVAETATFDLERQRGRRF
jgi:uncharacterized protein with ACT and thioredoxin-like domain